MLINRRTTASPALVAAALLLLMTDVVSGQWTTMAPDPGCPHPTAIAPCLCEYNELDDQHSVYCRDSITTARLTEIFSSAVQWPTTEMASFTAEYCTLAALPAGVFGPVKFRSITVKICELTSVDASVLEGQASTLKSLVLDHNRLTTVPFEVNLPFLESLHIAYNQLTALPALEYPNLKFMNAEHNAISNVDAALLRGTPSLERLYLQSNRLSTLPNGLVSSTPLLEELSLDHNALTSIPAGVFDFSGGQRTTIDLDLHANSINTVEAGAFAFPKSSCPRIFLDQNSLKSLDAGALEPALIPMAANQCPGLFISENDITCDCSLSWLAENEDYKASVVDGFMVQCDSTPLPDWTSDTVC